MFRSDTWQDIKFAVHAHPTLSEVLDELFKSAKVRVLDSGLFVPGTSTFACSASNHPDPQPPPTLPYTRDTVVQSM